MIQEFLDITTVAANSLPANKDVISFMRVDVHLLAEAGEYINKHEGEVAQLQSDNALLSKALDACQKAYNDMLESRNKLRAELTDALEQIELLTPATK